MPSIFCYGVNMSLVQYSIHVETRLPLLSIYGTESMASLLSHTSFVDISSGNLTHNVTCMCSCECMQVCVAVSVCRCVCVCTFSPSQVAKISQPGSDFQSERLRYTIIAAIDMCCECALEHRVSTMSRVQQCWSCRLVLIKRLYTACDNIYQ